VRSDVTVVADLVRAEGEGQLTVLQSIEEWIENAWALIGNLLDHGALAEDSLDFGEFERTSGVLCDPEFSLHVEGKQSVDLEICTVTHFEILHANLGLALSDVGASTRLALRVLLDEATLIGLHDGHGVALSLGASSNGVPRALIVVDVGKEGTSGALAGHIAQIDVELDGSTEEVVVLVRPFSTVTPLIIMDEGTIVVAHLNGLAIISGFQVSAVQALHIELIPAAIDLPAFFVIFDIGDERFEFGGLGLGVGLRLGIGGRVGLFLIVAISLHREAVEVPRLLARASGDLCA